MLLGLSDRPNDQFGIIHAPTAGMPLTWRGIHERMEQRGPSEFAR